MPKRLRSLLSPASRACLAALLALAATPAMAARAQPFVPVLRSDFPDPFVLPDGDRFLAYATNPMGGHVNVQMAISHDLSHWELLRDADGKPHDALPILPPWAKGGRTWAPEAIKAGNGFVLYFTASDRKTGRQCIGAAVATDAAGPFHSDASAPIVCQLPLGGSIDPDAFRDADGSLYLYFKNDGNAVGKPAALWAQKLSPDGLSVIGEPIQLLRSTRDNWQEDVIEAPSMTRNDGQYMLFFSGGYYGWPKEAKLSPYAIGFAACASATGPCTAAPQPILYSFSGSLGCLSGPGHQAIFDAGGRRFIAFHAWATDDVCRPADPRRYLYVAPLVSKDGKPAVGESLRPAR